MVWQSEYWWKHDNGHKDDHDYHPYTHHGDYDDDSDHVNIVRLSLIDYNDDDATRRVIVCRWYNINFMIKLVGPT